MCRLKEYDKSKESIQGSDRNRQTQRHAQSHYPDRNQREDRSSRHQERRRQQTIPEQVPASQP